VAVFAAFLVVAAALLRIGRARLLRARVPAQGAGR
jgi:hypothetical protein